MLYFITSNRNKFEEVKSMLGVELEQLDIDLPEIQDIDSKKIVREKLQEALKHRDGAFIVEDTSFSMDCLNGLPGPLMKWFLEVLELDRIYELADKLDNYGATAKTTIGYTEGSGELYFFEGILEGKMVKPRGEGDFGWGPIFQPTGFGKTYAEMTKSEKNEISHRKKAVDQLKKFLEKRDS